MEKNRSIGQAQMKKIRRYLPR